MYTRIRLYRKAVALLVKFFAGTKIIPNKPFVHTRDGCQFGSVPHYGVV